MIPLTWASGAVAVAFAAGLTIGYTKGHHDGDAGLRADWSAQQLRQAQEFSASLADSNKELQQLRAAERAKDAIYETNLLAIGRKHAAAIASLRNRAERPAVPASGAGAEACQGSTGAELSRPDAAFLVGEAHRADELRAALERCQGGDVATEGTRMDR